MSDIANLHDRYFKEYLENPGIAEKFLNEILPERIKNIADLKTLTFQKESFISQELKEAYSDLLFKGRLKSGRDIYIYFLIEHKSYLYELTPFQLLKYMVNIWEREINKEKKKKLTPIIPVVFYHGEEKWRSSCEFTELIEGEREKGELEEYLPRFRHILYELGEKEAVEKAGDAVIRVFLRSLFLKKVKGEEEVKILLRETLKEVREIGGEYGYLLKSVILYIIKTAEKLEKEVLFDYVEELIPERRGEIMTIAEQLKQEGKMEGIREGMEKGIEKGIEKGREETLKQTAINALKKGLDIETIAELTGLSVERIEELRKGLN